MKILINDSKDTNPNSTIVKGDFGNSIVLLTGSDIIKDDDKQIRHLRGFRIDTILIPKDFENPFGNEFFKKTKLYNAIMPSLSTKGKIIYY